MELTKLWAENKSAIVRTIIVVVVALLVIKFFDTIFVVGIVASIAVAAVLYWNHLSKKHGGFDGVWKALRKEAGFEEETGPE